MHSDDEAELRIAVDKGILTQEEADAVREEARLKERSPREVLAERGRRSDETLISPGRRALDAEERDDKQAAHPAQVSPLDETASVVGPAPVAPKAASPTVGAAPPAFPIPGWDRYEPMGLLGEGGMGRVFLAYDRRLRLYALLTGEPPIQGSNGLEVINNLATKEPRPPRVLDPGIPPDLEAITLKCLEKAPSARYDSARALAEDLDRFLSGEPVLARTGPGYRLRKRLRKHRLVLLAAATALLAVAVTVGWIRARREATERERLARQFTELVEQVESRSRYSALARLHDTRGERASVKAIQARMDQLEVEIRQAGEWAVGPGHYALGRAALTLGDPDKARQHLELAWQHGFQEPRVAYALGVALGIPYQRELLLLEAETHGVPGDDEEQWRAARRREIEQRYRDPALAYLKRSQGVEEPSAEYIAALIAFYEGRLDDALALLDVVIAKQRWFYEAPKLRGDILVLRIRNRFRPSTEEFKADLEAARKAYADAATIAESVPGVYLGMAELASIDMWVHQSGWWGRQSGDGGVKPYLEAQDALRRCLVAAPDDYMCWVTLARVHLAQWWYVCRAQNKSGPEVDEVIAKAVEAGEHALALAPTRPEARMILGETFGTQAWLRNRRHEDPREQLRKAFDMLEPIRSEDRNLGFHRELAGLFLKWAHADTVWGGDSLGHLDRAIQELKVILAIDDRVSYPWLGLAEAYETRGFDRRNSKPDFDLEQAALAYDKARLLISPNSSLAIEPTIYFYQERARWLRNRGGDPMPDLTKALELYRQELTRDPEGAHFGISEVLLEQARELWERGGDPAPLLEQSRAALEQARSIRPEHNATGYVNLGMLLAERARYQRARGEDPGPSVREAEKLMKQVLEQPENVPNLLVVLNVLLSSVHITQAGFNVDRGRAPGPDLARAEEELRQVWKHSPNGQFRFEEKAWFQLGEAQALRARWAARVGTARAEDFEEAAKSYEKALERQPDELEYLLGLGFHCATWATWLKQSGKDDGSMRKRGLELAERVLKAQPTWIRAKALRDSLLQTRP